MVKISVLSKYLDFSENHKLPSQIAQFPLLSKICCLQLNCPCLYSLATYHNSWVQAFLLKMSCTCYWSGNYHTRGHLLWTLSKTVSPPEIACLWNDTSNKGMTVKQKDSSLKGLFICVFIHLPNSLKYRTIIADSFTEIRTWKFQIFPHHHPV